MVRASSDKIGACARSFDGKFGFQGAFPTAHRICPTAPRLLHAADTPLVCRPQAGVAELWLDTVRGGEVALETRLANKIQGASTCFALGGFNQGPGFRLDIAPAHPQNVVPEGPYLY